MPHSLNTSLNMSEALDCHSQMNYITNSSFKKINKSKLLTSHNSYIDTDPNYSYIHHIKLIFDEDHVKNWQIIWFLCKHHNNYTKILVLFTTVLTVTLVNNIFI